MVKCFYRPSAVYIFFHYHIGAAGRPSCCAPYNGDRCNGAKGDKKVEQCLFRNIDIKVAYVYFHIQAL